MPKHTLLIFASKFLTTLYFEGFYDGRGRREAPIIFCGCFFSIILVKSSWGGYVLNPYDTEIKI
jgi:hypothetical protein